MYQFCWRLWSFCFNFFFQCEGSVYTIKNCGPMKSRSEDSVFLYYFVVYICFDSFTKLKLGNEAHCLTKLLLCLCQKIYIFLTKLKLFTANNLICVLWLIFSEDLHEYKGYYSFPDLQFSNALPKTWALFGWKEKL